MKPAIWDRFAAEVLPLDGDVGDAVKALQARVREAIRAEARGHHLDDYSRLADLPFLGEAAPSGGHALAEPPSDEDAGTRKPAERGRRNLAIRAEDRALAWYIARAATCQEDRAEANLIEAGFAVYVPRIAYWKRLSRIRKRAERPLFGGYLFVGVGAGQAVGQAIDIEGVHNFIRIGGVPRQVAFAPIAALAEQEVAGEFDHTRRDKRKDPEPGTPVNLIGGRFRGWPAKFHERREDERVEVLMTMLGKESPLVVDPEDVELPGGEG